MLISLGGNSHYDPIKNIDWMSLYKQGGLPKCSFFRLVVRAATPTVAPERRVQFVFRSIICSRSKKEIAKADMTTAVKYGIEQEF